MEIYHQMLTLFMFNVASTISLTSILKIQISETLQTPLSLICTQQKINKRQNVKGVNELNNFDC